MNRMVLSLFASDPPVVGSGETSPYLIITAGRMTCACCVIDGNMELRADTAKAVTDVLAVMYSTIVLSIMVFRVANVTPTMGALWVWRLL